MCKCNTDMDVRARCCPSINKCFNRCPARVDTAYFHIMNNRDSGIDIDSVVSFREKVEKLCGYARATPYRLKESDMDALIYLLIEDAGEDIDEEE